VFSGFQLAHCDQPQQHDGIGSIAPCRFTGCYFAHPIPRGGGGHKAKFAWSEIRGKEKRFAEGVFSTILGK
jgi:hypothetical protein